LLMSIRLNKQAAVSKSGRLGVKAESPELTSR